eukprot:CAMPEP_0182864744 /NCGR_PEP_ID=MMETSP0034_2-20130328/7324_1 /TAXON_ID=156128 /ORGANISM="Nephroselmis pyriformis, Strain CCMP717" /LENGTH=493 /DNA_ID=CAMNT_0024997007 /DNA_START=222 /DNA_END=1699 /DNA_ORIENTATION=+
MTEEGTLGGNTNGGWAALPPRSPARPPQGNGAGAYGGPPMGGYMVGGESAGDEVTLRKRVAHLEARLSSSEARCRELELSGHRPQVVSAYAEPKERMKSAKTNLLRVGLVTGDCMLIGLQPILVHMTKGEDGKFGYSPVTVNFMVEVCKCVFAVLLLVVQAYRAAPHERDPAVVTVKGFLQAMRTNWLLMVPALLYAINNYLKFVMQLYFKPATVKMLGNLKVLTIAILLKLVMKRTFSLIQWEALYLLIVGITINQLACKPQNMGANPANANDANASILAWTYTLMSVTIPSAASVYNEFALKKNYDTSVHLQNFFMYFYGAAFNLMGLCLTAMMGGLGNGRHIFSGHTSMTLVLVANNAMQGILSSFFFKFADTILKKYSSTVATVFTGLMSAAFFGHQLTINFCIGVSIVFVSMHQFFAAAPAKGKGLGGGREKNLSLAPSPSLDHLHSFNKTESGLRGGDGDGGVDGMSGAIAGMEGSLSLGGMERRQV